MQFRYHEKLVGIYRLALWTSLFAFILSSLFFFRLNAGNEILKVTGKYLATFFIPFSLWIRMHLKFTPIIFCSYELEGDSLVYKYKNKKKVIDFHQIESLTFSGRSMRFFGGFSLKLKSGEKFNFLSILKNSHLLLESIGLSCPQLVDPAQIAKKVSSLARVSSSWERMVIYLLDWKLLALKYIIWPTLVAGVLLLFQELGLVGDKSGLVFLSFLVIHFLIGLSLNSFEEYIFFNKIRPTILTDKILHNVVHTLYFLFSFLVVYLYLRLF